MEQQCRTDLAFRNPVAPQFACPGTHCTGTATSQATRIPVIKGVELWRGVTEIGAIVKPYLGPVVRGTDEAQLQSPVAIQQPHN